LNQLTVVAVELDVLKVVTFNFTELEKMPPQHS
jgi:hypothetical protein